MVQRRSSLELHQCNSGTKTIGRRIRVAVAPLGKPRCGRTAGTGDRDESGDACSGQHSSIVSRRHQTTALSIRLEVTATTAHRGKSPLGIPNSGSPTWPRGARPTCFVVRSPESRRPAVLPDATCEATPPSAIGPVTPPLLIPPNSGLVLEQAGCHRHQGHRCP